MYPKPLQIMLIRHGQSESNLDMEHIAGTAKNSPLTHNGILQVTRLGEYLKSQNTTFSKIYSSQCDRAFQTANIIKPFVGEPQVIKTGTLNEVSQGEWEGKTKRGVHTSKQLLAMKTAGVDFTPPNGESLRRVLLEAVTWIYDDILADKELANKTIAIVSHGAIIRSIIAELCGFGERFMFTAQIDNASHSLISFNEQGWKLRYYNRETPDFIPKNFSA